MTIVATNNTMVAINNNTTRRANVIARRTNSDEMGIIKSQLIDLLKAKLQNGIVHFLFFKKDGSIREAWGTTAHNLMKVNILGTGVCRDYVNCICYWDVEKGGFRSLRFELNAFITPISEISANTKANKARSVVGEEIPIASLIKSYFI